MIVQIFPFRPGTSHSAKEIQYFGQNVQICRWSALAWGRGGGNENFYLPWSINALRDLARITNREYPYYPIAL